MKEAHTLESTRNTADDVKNTAPSNAEPTNLLRHASQPRMKKIKDFSR